MNLIKLVLAFTILICTDFHKPTKVYFVPALHSLHKVNMQYNYDTLFHLVKRLHPDVIAVEIRSEDINKDSFYLKQNYPYEMWAMKYWFANKQVEGFDWLGTDIEGKTIPANYCKEVSAIKKWERALDADSIYARRIKACNSYTDKRIELLKTLSLKELLNSNDTELTQKFYQCLQTQLSGSVHQRVLDFYSLRNKKLLENIQNLIKRNKGKTIVILTGDDHYVYLKDKFRNDPVFN